MDAPTEAPKLRESLRSLRGRPLILFGGTFINGAGTFVLPFFALYLTRKGYSVTQAGVAVGACGLGNLVAYATGGLLADRMGRRNAIALSMFANGALALALWRARSPALIYPLMFGFGWAAHVSWPAEAALVADLVPSRSQVTAFTVFRVVTNASEATGLALGGLLADRSFDVLFVGEAATSIAYAFISLLALPQGVRSTRREEVDLPTARRAILADHGFLLFLVGMLLMRLVYAQYISTLPLHVKDQGYGPSTYGVLASLNGVLVVLAELPVIAWVQRHDGFRMVALGQILIGLGFASLLFADTFPLLVGTVAVWSLGEMCALSVAQGIAADRAPDHPRGRYQSALLATRGAAFMAGPVLGTLAYSAGPEILWWSCGGMGVLAAWLSLSARRFPALALGPCRRPILEVRDRSPLGHHTVRVRYGLALPSSSGKEDVTCQRTPPASPASMGSSSATRSSVKASL
jgi:MFS family permease